MGARSLLSQPPRAEQVGVPTSEDSHADGLSPLPSLQQSKVVLLEDLASQVGLRTQVSPSRWPAPWNMATGSVRLSEGDRLKDGSLDALMQE